MDELAAITILGASIVGALVGLFILLLGREVMPYTRPWWRFWVGMGLALLGVCVMLLCVITALEVLVSVVNA